MRPPSWTYGAERYSGESEPIDPVAGHIPGAINLPQRQMLDPDGRFLPPDEIAGCLYEAGGTEDAVLYCGSGITARTVCWRWSRLG